MEGSEEDKFNFKRPKNRHQHDDFSRRQIHSLDYCYQVVMIFYTPNFTFLGIKTYFCQYFIQI